MAFVIKRKREIAAADVVIVVVEFPCERQKYILFCQMKN
jgi:hypothetical protein